MDPLFRDEPSETGIFRVPEPKSATSVELFYELRGDHGATRKIVLIMGALATRKHFDQLAYNLSKKHNFQVLTFDHRGVGKSTCVPVLAKQTSTMLADDAIKLIQHVFSGAKSISILGGSMGGMVAQKIAVRVAAERLFKLQALYLSVTARNYSFARFLPIPPSVYKFLFRMVLPSDARKMIESILPKTFSKEYLELVHRNAPNGETMKTLWLNRWVEEYNDWWAFPNLDICASQSIVAQEHYLSDAEVKIILESRVPVMVHIAENDSVMNPKDQVKLAKSLNARTLVTHGGHMAGIDDFKKYCESVAEHCAGDKS